MFGVRIAYCREQMIKWSCPREIRFCSSLPRTRVGKIDYRSLQQQYPAEEQASGGNILLTVARTGSRALALHGVPGRGQSAFSKCPGRSKPL